MLKVLLAGGALGLAAGFAPGPLLTMVISQTISHGFREGVKTAFSPIITDLPIVLVSTLLVSGFYGLKSVLGLVSITGGLLLVYLAYENITVSQLGVSDVIGKPRSLFKGALINALSPHPYLFWITVGSPLLLAAYAQSAMDAGAFVVGFYSCLIGAKIILAYMVLRSHRFLSGGAYRWLMRALGIALLIFAVFMFRDGFALLSE